MLQRQQPDYKTFENPEGDVLRYNQNDPNSRPELFYDAPPDPNAGLESEYKRALIAKIKEEIERANDPNIRNKMGLNPIILEGPDGPVPAQLSEGGELRPAAMPPGFKYSPKLNSIDLGPQFGAFNPYTGQVSNTIPKDLAGAEAEKAKGKIMGETQANLPSAEVGAAQTVRQIDELLNNPNIGSISGIESWLPDPALAAVQGPEALGLRRRVEQLQGSSFLQAYETLKGGGQITEVEGKKAEAAIARLNAAQSDADFTQALKDFKDVIQVGLTRLRAKAGIETQPSAMAPAPAAPTSGGVVPYTDYFK
jgi:hypothetical protein